MAFLIFIRLSRRLWHNDSLIRPLGQANHTAKNINSINSVIGGLGHPCSKMLGRF
jgi:hypothetical protein